MMSACSRTACRKGQRWRKPLLNTENRLMREGGEEGGEMEGDKEGSKWEKSYQTAAPRQFLKWKGHILDKQCVSAFVEFPCKHKKIQIEIIHLEEFDQDGSKNHNTSYITFNTIIANVNFHCILNIV